MAFDKFGNYQTSFDDNDWRQDYHEEEMREELEDELDDELPEYPQANYKNKRKGGTRK